MFELLKIQPIRLIIDKQVVSDFGSVVLVKNDKGYQVATGFSDKTIKDQMEQYDEGGIIHASWDFYPSYATLEEATDKFNQKVEELRTSITPQVAENLIAITVFPEGYVTVIQKRHWESGQQQEFKGKA